eukprot:3690540-Prymnesium_polylepis.2
MTVQEGDITPWRALNFSLVNAGAIFVPRSTHSNSIHWQTGASVSTVCVVAHQPSSLHCPAPLTCTGGMCFALTPSPTAPYPARARSQAHASIWIMQGGTENAGGATLHVALNWRA